MKQPFVKTYLIFRAFTVFLFCMVSTGCATINPVDSLQVEGLHVAAKFYEIQDCDAVSSMLGEMRVNSAEATRRHLGLGEYPYALPAKLQAGTVAQHQENLFSEYQRRCLQR